MSKIFKFLLVVLVLVGAAYVAGLWPQRERISALQAENVTLRQRAEAAETRVGAGMLLGELLTLREVVQDMNYGQARTLSSPFFEHLRAEAGRTTDAGLKQAMEACLALRDPVTVALTQGDAAAFGHLRECERRMRLALGYPAPPPSPSPSPTPAPGVPFIAPSPTPLPIP